MPTIEDAILLATEAHRGQKDMGGLPYILHPLRMMASFMALEDGDARMAAVLHDVVEDTPITLAQLRCDCYPAAVVEAVDALSRREDETYPDYIARVGKNALAVRVKLKDLRDNLDPERRSAALLVAHLLSRYREAEEHLTRVAARSASYSEAER